MTQPGSYWGSDTPISLPVPNPDNEVIIDMGATGMGIYGLAHNVNEADLAEYLIPTFSPGETING